MRVPSANVAVATSATIRLLIRRTSVTTSLPHSAAHSRNRMRIAIGGFQHETNTFAPAKATYAHFERDGGWPGLRRGGAIMDTMVACNLPIAGFIEHMKGRRHQLLPTAWASAEPSAHVTRDAYERIAAMIVDGIRDAAPDAVYLDLHGAMVSHAPIGRETPQEGSLHR